MTRAQAEAVARLWKVAQIKSNRGFVVLQRDPCRSDSEEVTLWLDDLRVLLELHQDAVVGDSDR